MSQHDGTKDAYTHSCVAISVVDVPHSAPHRAASLPRPNESSQTIFAGNERQRRALIDWPKRKENANERICEPLV